MVDNPPDLERLIHESLEQLGWEADAKFIAERVKRLNIGLPAEDEFSIICGWLGSCELVHKLDQQQYPVSSNDTFQVPDLLARFTARNGGKYTVLIEVKSSERNVLSFKPDYVKKLKVYAAILGLPLLIAWKSKGMWVLVSIDDFQLAIINYNLAFTNAFTLSLMGILAGDFSFTPNINSGVHISFKKEKLISTEKIENGSKEHWQMKIDDVYFTNGKNEELRKLSKNAQQLFHTWPLKDTEIHTNTHIILHHVIDEESTLFAHMALIRLLSFYGKDDQNIHWREYLGDHATISNIKDFRIGIEEDLKKGIVRYIFDIDPTNIPDFLNTK